jgi:hypothetical protein
LGPPVDRRSKGTNLAQRKNDTAGAASSTQFPFLDQIPDAPGGDAEDFRCLVDVQEAIVKRAIVRAAGVNVPELDLRLLGWNLPVVHDVYELPSTVGSRIGTTQEVSMSSLEGTMLTAIVAAHRRWNQPFQEAGWRTFVAPLRPHLRKIEDAGADADYVLFVLSNCRWRFRCWGDQADLDQCLKLRDTISDSARREGVLWRKLGPELGTRVESLLGDSVFFGDEGPFGELTGEDGIRSRSTYRALVALSDHFRKSIPQRRINREQMLADAVEAAGMRSGDEVAGPGRSESFSTLDWIHKRLQRAPGQLREPVRGWIVASSPQDMVIAYHRFHLDAGFGCGRACQLGLDW